MKKTNFFLTILIIFFIISTIISPQRILTASFNGISAWTFYVLPNLLPFAIFTKTLLDLGIFEKWFLFLSKPIKKIYGTSHLASNVFIMSVVAGYPVGAKMIADLFESGKISQVEAVRMNSFCSNSGPMFILGSVGTSMLISYKAGVIILVCHILSALINGLIYRKYRLKTMQNFEIKKLSANQNFDFSSIITSSLQSILCVGGIVCLFFVIIECFSPALSLLPENAQSILSGIVEMTKGCLDVSKTTNLKFATITSTFLISFSGFSIIFQSFALLKKVKIPFWILTLQKTTQGLISLVLATILCNIFL